MDVRKRILALYKNNLTGVSTMKLREGTNGNFAYYPILFQNEAQLLRVQKLLNAENIFPRRYFYPSLNLLPYTDKKPCPISEKIASRVLCLPMYHNLSEAMVLKICNIINEGG